MAAAVNKQEKSSFATKDLLKVFTIVRKNWWLVLIFAAVAYCGALIYNYKQTEVYSVSSQLLLKSNDQLNSSSLISDNSFYGNTYRTYIDNSNEMRVLRSYDLILKAIQRLDFQVSYFIVGRIRMKEEYSGLPFTVTYTSVSPDLYEQDIEFSVLNFNEYQLTYRKGDEEVKKKGFFNKEFISPDMEILVKRNPIMAEKTINGFVSVKYIIQMHRIETVVKKYQSALAVSNPEYTNILQMSVADEISQRAVRFLDTLAAVYIENSVTSRLEVNKNTLFYIDKQMEQVTSMLKNIEDSIEDFKDRNAILDLEKEGDDYFSKLSMYDSEKKSVELQDSMLSDLRHYVISNRDTQFLPPNAFIIDDKFIQQTVAELYQKQIDLNNALISSTNENFGIKSFRQTIKNLKADLLVYIGNAKKALKGQKDNINLQISSYIDTIRALSPKQRGLLERKREHSVNESMYLFLLQKKANTVIARAGIVPDIRIIESARPAGLVSPNKPKNLYTFLSIGLVLGVLVIFVRITFFARIDTTEDLKGVTTLPVIGEIIQSSTLQELVVSVINEPKSPLTEAFRAIRTNLQYMALNPGSQIIVVSSNNPGEGKTFCSINLAAILAKAGKRVVLLELDLHKPRIHKGLQIESEIGVSTFAIGKHELADCIKPTIVENLSVILSGPQPPNPSEMVLSPKIDEMIEYCKQHFDFVIIDTPPVGLISDAFVLMKKADISLFVIHTRFNYRNSVNNAHEIVAISKIKNFAFILNGVKRKRSRYYYNRYNYNYNYNYSYGAYGSYGSYGSYGDDHSSRKKRSGKKPSGDNDPGNNQ